MTSERMAVMGLADQWHMPDDLVLARLTARQWTRYQARALVQHAQTKIPKMLGSLK